MTDERHVAALMALAEANIPADVQELLVFGNADIGVAPGALGKAIAAIAHAATEPLRPFSIGDEVMSISGGTWLGMAEGDTGIIRDVIAGPPWTTLAIDGFDGIYSAFRFRLVAPHAVRKPRR